MVTYNNTIDSPVNTYSPTIYYCDPGDIQRRLSVEGQLLRTQDYGKGSIAGEAGVIEDCIWDATETINMFCNPLYDPGALVRSGWVNRRATDIAVYNLCIRRGNPAPSS